LNVSCDPAGAFVPSGAWDADNGTLVLLVTAGGLLRNTSYALSFWVRNGDSEQPEQELNVEGTVHAYGANDALGAFRAGTFTSPVHLDALVSVNESRLGVPGASTPGRMFEAQFLTDAIAQSFPLASGSNMITVRAPAA